MFASRAVNDHGQETPSSRRLTDRVENSVCEARSVSALRACKVSRQGLTLQNWQPGLNAEKRAGSGSSSPC